MNRVTSLYFAVFSTPSAKLNGSAANAMSAQAKSAPSYRFFPSARFLTALLAAIAVTCQINNFSMLNFTLVCMVNTTAAIVSAQSRANETDSTAVNLYPNCPSMNSLVYNSSQNGSFITTSASGQDYNGDLSWTRSQQANVIAAFAWTITIFAFPCGLLVHRFGVKKTLITGLVISSLCSALVPWASYLGDGEWGLFCVRLIAGSVAGVIWPCILRITTAWAVAKDASIMKSIIACGFPIGNCVAYAASGLFCSTVGWPYSYYFSSALNVAVAILLLLLFIDDPKDSPRISEEELAYIVSGRAQKGACNEQPPLKDIPWKAMLTSPALWAANSSGFCVSWAYYYVASYMPTYMKEVLYFGAAFNGLLSSLPHLAQFTSRVMFGFIADSISHRFQKTTAVKLFDAVSVGTPGIMFAIISFMDCDTAALAVACFTLSHFAMAANVGGYIKSMYYIAPRYVGIIGGICGIFNNIPAIFVSYAVGAMTKGGTLFEWRTTFYLSVAIQAFGVAVFAIFGSGEEQQWAKLSFKRRRNSISISAVETRKI